MKQNNPRLKKLILLFLVLFSLFPIKSSFASVDNIIEHPVIDGVINGNEWYKFDDIVFPWSVTYKLGLSAGAEPWDKNSINAKVSVFNHEGHLYICLIIPDDYLNEAFPMDIISIKLGYLENGMRDTRYMVINGQPYQDNFNLFDAVSKSVVEDGPDDEELGGTKDINAMYSHNDTQGISDNGAYIMEFDLPLSSISQDENDVSLGELEIVFEYSEWTENYQQSTYWRNEPYNFTPVKPIIIDKTIVSDNRCDIGSEQTISHHLSHGLTGQALEDISISINNDDYVSDNLGWVNITHSLASVGEYRFEVSINGIEFSQIDPIAEIIWDQVVLNIPEVQRIGIGEQFSWSGEYAYDGEPFEGSIIVNNTGLPLNHVGEVKLSVLGIVDPEYGLSSFEAGTFTTIYDEIEFDLRIADSRIDVGTIPEFTVLGEYLFDQSRFEGRVEVSDPLDDVGEKEITIENIADALHDVSSYTSNKVECIWDRLRVTKGGSSDHSASIGEHVSVWFTAEYEYDSKPFTNEDGQLFINYEPATWSIANNRWEYEVWANSPMEDNYMVTWIDDEQYGITNIAFDVPDVEVEWKQTGIPGFPSLSIAIGIILGYSLKKRYSYASK